METAAKKKKYVKKAEKAKVSSSITIEKNGKKYTADTVSAEEIMKRRNTAYKFLV
ncbi:hypothetical protein [Foetidibacter luteolus]|uniref:hypothetical protein n=1 Tax=Foetidibacter luteolus TaxID=2608880 RepID=UPI00129B4FB8|nr:hypothetical protein [Foetidibacter luteolus]